MPYQYLMTPTTAWRLEFVNLFTKYYVIIFSYSHQMYLPKYLYKIPSNESRIEVLRSQNIIPVELRAHSKITSHFVRRCIPSVCVAKTWNIQIFLRFRALPAGRLNPLNCELIFSWTLRVSARNNSTSCLSFGSSSALHPPTRISICAAGCAL